MASSSRTRGSSTWCAPAPAPRAAALARGAGPLRAPCRFARLRDSRRLTPKTCLDGVGVQVYDLLGDSNPMVVSNAVASLAEIAETSEVRSRPRKAGTFVGRSAALVLGVAATAGREGSEAAPRAAR
eukprot:2926083-Prymnesium_polylepis.1